jgi:predicted transcriptional regulator
VELCQAGLSNLEIADTLGISGTSVWRYLKEYWEQESRVPSDLDISELELRRTQRRQDLETARQKILTEMAILDKSKTINYSAEERCVIAATMCRLSDSLVRISERFSAMDGLDAPKKTETKVTNNVAVMVANGGMEELKRLAQARVLSVTNGDTDG